MSTGSERTRASVSESDGRRAGQGRALHVFDMDGTLLRGAATLELARHFGNPAAGDAIESRWLAGDITDREFWQTLLDICGDATDAQLDEAFYSSGWLTGVAETFADIRGRGETVVVISQSPAFFVRRLELWGAHETFGSDLEIGQPLRDDASLLPEHKVSITAAILERLGLGPEACVAYGDSSSDVDLFRWLPHTVGVNPSPIVAELVAAQYFGADIREAYSIGRSLMAASAADPTVPV